MQSSKRRLKKTLRRNFVDFKRRVFARLAPKINYEFQITNYECLTLFLQIRNLKFEIRNCLSDLCLIDRFDTDLLVFVDADVFTAFDDDRADSESCADSCADRRADRTAGNCADD